MSINFDSLTNEPRLLMEVDLKPLQGHRFQPTGFPDLGPARYTAPDGVEMLLVESAQSVANRMELACWDARKQDLAPSLEGLPYIAVVDAQGMRVTNSVLEAHRINSEYIMKKDKKVYRVLGHGNGRSIDVASEIFKEEFATWIGYEKDGRVDWDKFYRSLLMYDANSLIHGCFLEEIGGRLRVTRSLSGFVEAEDISAAESGGVKNNIVQPDLKGGEGNVPYHRTEFTAKSITAYFNLDLALLRSYGFPEDAHRLLVALALFKIRRFLSTGLRLRTACDLEPIADLEVTRPRNGFTIPSEAALLDECKSLIGRCKEAGLFAEPPITEVQWAK